MALFFVDDYTKKADKCLVLYDLLGDGVDEKAGADGVLLEPLR